jgi:hypothetical protein
VATCPIPGSHTRCSIRVSQVVVLPPFQRKGYGGKMLRAVYKHARSDDRILDVSVEDPSPDFQVSLGREHKLYTKNCAKRAREEESQREGAVERVTEGERETKERHKSHFRQGHSLVFFDEWCFATRLSGTS